MKWFSFVFVLTLFELRWTPPVRHLSPVHVPRLDSALRRERDEMAMRHDELMHELHTFLGAFSDSILVHEVFAGETTTLIHLTMNMCNV